MNKGLRKKKISKSALLSESEQPLDGHRQREAMLQALIFAAEQFLKSSDWRANIDNLLERLGKTINASHCYLFEHFADQDGQELSSLRYEWAAPGFTSSVDDPVYRAHPVRVIPGTTDEILQRGEMLVATASTFPPAEKERLSQLGVKALMEAPVIVNGYWWGTLGVDDMTGERGWSPVEADMLRAASNVLGAAIKRQADEAILQSELEERRSVEVSLRQRESILGVVAEAANRLLKSSDWRSEINSILENLGGTIRASHAYLFENHIREDGIPATSMRFEWTSPSHPTDLGVAKYQSIPLKEPDFEGWYEVMSAGLPYLGDLQHASPEDVDFLRDRGMQALLDVPIYVDGAWWGTIGFDDMDHSRVWSNAEVDALVVASNILGAAIQRQQAEAELRTREQNYRALYEMAEKQTQELALLSNVRNVMSQELDLPSLLRSVVEAVAESFGYALVSVYLLEGDTLVMQHQVGYDKVIARIPLNKGIAGRVASTGKSVFLEDVRSAPDFLGAIENIVSEICIPLFDEGRVVGILNVESVRGVKLTQVDLDLLDALGQHIGIAIGRVRLYTDAQRELEARKQAEIERENLIAELAAKNAELERFTYTVSHDLKAPLFTIRGFLGYLEKDMLAGDRERFQKDALRIADATEKMQQLLNDLLELSRIGRLMNEPKEIQLDELVREILALLHGQIQERGVTIQVQENLPRVFADRRRIGEVLQNLIENAVKFMGDQPDPRVEIGQSGEENGMPILFVRDNGIGISDDHFERVFGLFNKLDPKTDGTGIGLALVKRIIEFHGGRIWVESEAGKGAAFFFTLPAQGMPDSDYNRSSRL
ncbi:MAG: GAF domain-containing protein [Anaerolineales bacterium]|nr:MAG: GAF domain-containing protein [Anaerolineales bacterium]